MKCVICGKDFEKIRKNQMTCSAECGRLRNISRVLEAYHRNKGKAAARICSICGKPIDYELEQFGRRARVHDECVMRDLICTVKSGHKLTAVQYNRMSRRNISTKDLIVIIGENENEKRVQDLRQSI